MDTLKKYFPLSFKYADTVANLIIGILIYVIGGAVAGAIISLLAAIPVIGVIFTIISMVLEIYCLAGIVIQVLLFAKVLK